MQGFFSTSSWQTKEASRPTIARCGKCKLHKQCHSPKMEPTGDGARRILFVGEAPGTQEDRQGTQLVGEPGQLLRRMLREMKVDLDDCWKTNAVICRPTDNEMKPSYIECCRPNLLKTIEALHPNVIILLGNHAVASLIGPLWPQNMGPLTKWIGWKIPLARYSAWVCPTYHPSYLIRNEKDELLRGMFREHLRQAICIEHKAPPLLELSDLQNEVDILHGERQIIRRLRALNNKSGKTAFDFETTGLKPEHKDHRIISCSFCFEGKDTFAFLVTEDIVRRLSQVLRNPHLKKIASNMKFEERWSVSKLGHTVAGWEWDTMLASHILDNRPGITSIKFQTFVQLGVPDYNSHLKDLLRSTTKSANGFNQIRKINTEDLLMYNGIDSLVEFCVAEEQRKILCQ